MYEQILGNRLRADFEKSLLENQAGFRPGRGPQDWIFSLRQISERALSEKVFYMCT